MIYIMEKFLKKHLKFLFSMLKIGIIGFGGGTALIPIIYNEVVDTYVSEGEFEKYATIASVTPGALPVEIASGIGYKLFGRVGMILGALAMALPGALLSVLLLSLNIQDVSWIKYISILVSLYIIFNLFFYVSQTNHKWLIALVFMVTCGKNLWKVLNIGGSPLYISNIQIFVVLLLCLIHQKQVRIKFDIELFKDLLFLLIPLIVMVSLFPESIFYVVRGCLSILLSFGGGDAYLTVVDGVYIDSGMVNNDVFYGTIVPLVNLLPGSILCKTLPSIGYVLGGWIWAIIGLVCGISVSCCVFRIAQILELKEWKWSRPVIAGLMCNVVFSLVIQIVNTINM